MGECLITRRDVPKSIPPKFTYTGTYNIIKDSSNPNNWMIEFLSSGTLTFTKENVTIDAFLVGGGAGGNAGYTYCGGAGGCSGKTLTIKSKICAANSPFVITIGAGGSGGVGYAGFGGAGGSTSAFGNTVAGGTVYKAEAVHQNGDTGGNSEGGSGGGQGAEKNNSYYAAKGGADGADGVWTGWYASGKGQGTTTRAFGESSGTLYASGGGGGGFVDFCNGAAGGDTTAGTGGSGGNGGNAQANTGSGGGGGGGGKSAYYAGGAGGSGIVIIRNAR